VTNSSMNVLWWEPVGVRVLKWLEVKHLTCKMKQTRVSVQGCICERVFEKLASSECILNSVSWMCKESSTSESSNETHFYI